jgi:spore germination cell wall hydrolase CwlJ-like protein
MELKMKETIYKGVISFSLKIIVVLIATTIIFITGKYYIDYKINDLKSEITRQQDFSSTMQQRLKDLDCLGINIYWEAGNQSFEGKVAVAQTTLNRVKDGRFGKSVCEVVYSRSLVHGKVLCQFSWVCENKRRVIPIHDKQWQESQEVAKKVLLENFRLPSLHESLYFHADYVNPKWGKERITKIDRHIFYKEKP